MSTYFLYNPLTVLPSPEGNMASPWKVLGEVPSNDVDTFLSAVRLTSLEALRTRLGDQAFLEAMRQLSGDSARSVPTERQITSELKR